MKKYKVLMEGRNFLLLMDGKEQRVGFYTTRWVEAANPEEAELKAAAAIKADPRLKSSVKNPKNDPPMLHLTEMSEVEAIERPGAGFTFYPDNGDDE